MICDSWKKDNDNLSGYEPGLRMTANHYLFEKLYVINALISFRPHFYLGECSVSCFGPKVRQTINYLTNQLRLIICPASLLSQFIMREDSNRDLLWAVLPFIIER
jgi:hypothetical protein